MKKYFLFFLLFCALKINSQTSLSNDTLIWHLSRPLSWSDFKGEVIDGIGLSGEIFCMNLANFEKKNALVKTTYSVVSVFDRNKSWVDPKIKTSHGLMYFQVTFDIYEVHARKLRKDLSEADFGSDPNQQFQQKYNASMTELTQEFNSFRKETKMGSVMGELKKWRIKIDEELKQLESYKN